MEVERKGECMDRLILLRHGKAESDSDSGDDFDRRLAARGLRESADMAAHLADLGFTPQIALISPAARTRGTWEAACGAFAGAEARFLDELYHADAGTIRRAAESVAAEAKTVLVVGHRLRTMRHADRIVVMDGGCVAGQGTHGELLRDCETYRRLWRDQEQAREWTLGSRA